MLGAVENWNFGLVVNQWKDRKQKLVRNVERKSNTGPNVAHTVPPGSKKSILMTSLRSSIEMWF